MQCILCAVISCSSGFNSTACVTGSVLDCECTACIPPSGSYNWTTGCDFECNSGYYAVDDGCTQCSEIQCAAGYFRIDCGVDHDAYCLACPQPPSENFVWLSESCQYACNSGWYKNPFSNGCLQCSPIDCQAGYYSVPCGLDYDSGCYDCIGGGAGVVWTQGCDFVCEPGVYWLSSDSLCQPCSSDLQCESGWQASQCGPRSDAVCSPCVPVENATWIGSGCDQYACNAGFFLASDQSCIPCDIPECEAGQRPVECIDGSDSFCEPCQIPTSVDAVVWTGGCNYTCADGFFMEDGLNCLPCLTLVQCPPGFMQSKCTATQDVQCVPCSNFQIGYQWTYGCEFSCAPGYFQNGLAACVPCSTDVCSPGTYAVACGAYSDLFCITCPVPVGAYVWTEGCGFKCADGHFLSGMTCVSCSVPRCVPGKYASRCKENADSTCVNCVRPLNSNGLIWTNGCQFKCGPGSYNTNDGCSLCTTAYACEPGYYSTPCSQYADQQCAPCTQGEGVVWTSGCDFVCMDGFYHRNSTCERCSAALTCDPGSILIPCTKQSDAFCSPCSFKGVGGVFTQGCAIECKPGYFGPDCMPCSSVQNCVPGSYSMPCTNVSDAACLACVPPSGGPFEWSGSGCGFRCLPGFVAYNDTQCVDLAQVFAQVKATLALENTVTQICVDLVVFLKAMSDALGTLSQGTAEFVTDIMSLDGVPCVSNICPQCSTARRLLLGASTVSVVTDSRSTTPCVLNTTVAPPQLTAALLVTLSDASSSLLPRTIVVNKLVLLTTQPSIQDQTVSLNIFEQHGEIFFIVLGLIVLSLVVIAMICQCIFQKARAVLVSCGMFTNVRLCIPRRQKEALIPLIRI